MRVAIAGAGAVGRSIARELTANGHTVLLIDKVPRAVKKADIEGVTVLLADACEISTLEEAALPGCDVMIAATGDDKANLVVSLLAKTEFAVPRTVARINHPSNEWLFNESWGVDVSVSTPRIMSALVEEAVAVGDAVRLFSFQKGETNMVEITLPEDSPCVGVQLRDLEWPDRVKLLVALRDNHVIEPEPSATLEAHDELLFLAPSESERALERLLAPREGKSERPRT